MIAEILRRLGSPTRTFVEFGVGPGIQGNCVALADALGWKGLFMEAEPDLSAALARKYESVSAVRTARETVTPDNVCDVFQRNGVPVEFDVLSIDVDGPDLWIWRELSAYRPKLVVIEYNAGLGFDRPLTVPRDKTDPWDATDYFGASLPALEIVADELGYRLVYTDLTGTNAFFVRGDLDGELPSAEAVPRRPPNYGLLGLRHPSDPQNRPWVEP